MIAPWIDARCQLVCAWYHNVPVWFSSWNLHFNTMFEEVYYQIFAEDNMSLCRLIPDVLTMHIIVKSSWSMSMHTDCIMVHSDYQFFLKYAYTNIPSYCTLVSTVKSSWHMNMHRLHHNELKLPSNLHEVWVCADCIELCWEYKIFLKYVFICIDCMTMHLGLSL